MYDLINLTTGEIDLKTETIEKAKRIKEEMKKSGYVYRIKESEEKKSG